VDITERITLLINELGMSRNRFATQMGELNSTLHKMLTGGGKPSYKLIDSIISTYKVNPTWLFTGKGEMFFNQSESNIIEKANVHVLESSASAGFGCLNNPENGLHKYFLPMLDGVPGLYIDIEVEGDSMEPALFNKDRVIARKVENEGDIIGGSIFVIDRKNGEALIKRLYEKDADHFELVSENEIYQPKTLNKQEDINGLYCFVLRMTRRAGG